MGRQDECPGPRDKELGRKEIIWWEKEIYHWFYMRVFLLSPSSLRLPTPPPFPAIEKALMRFLYEAV